jgi:beta-phosphoglucomutase family hydrolase
MFKSVIFDMDGVITDSEPIHFEVEKKLFKDLGLAISDEEHRSFVGTVSREMWSHIKDKYKLNQSVEELVEIERTSYMDYLLSQEKERPIPGVADLIEELYRNNVKLVVASSASVKNIEIVLKMFDLERFFETKVSGDEVKNGKPAPDIFLYAAKIIGTQPEECIIIEDSENGVEAAKSAGMKCIGFENPNSGKQDLSSADMVINSFSDINYQKLQQIYEQWQKIENL